MATKRWKGNPVLVALAGTEVIPATSIAGGAKVGGGSVAAEGDIHITVDQLKAGMLSVQTVTSAATITPVATNDNVVVSALAVDATIADPTGTAAQGQGFVIDLYSAATQDISFGSGYRGYDAALPTTTVAGKWMSIPVRYNATDSKWDVLAVSQQL